jgi:predicted phosphohydrolase
MKQLTFDLISDTHIEHWRDNVITPTALICIVAGNVARDRGLLIEALCDLSKMYEKVFYLDGTMEHLDNMDDLTQNYKDLTEEIDLISDVIYLHNNVVIVDNYAIVATNGWWDYNFDPLLEARQSKQYTQHLLQCDPYIAEHIESRAYDDTAYLHSSIKRLQTFTDVQHIIIVTHTVPHYSLLSHDTLLVNNHDINLMGNSTISEALDADIGNKVKAWCFGHYSASIDETINNIRFVNNARGAPTALHGKHIYFPKTITV